MTKSTCTGIMKLVETLALTTRGIAWLKVLPVECINALYYIDDKLDSLWNNNLCFPVKNRVLLPFHMIAPEEVTMVILCKEPYSSSSMATGIPVETGGKLSTTSEKVFMDLISKYWNNTDTDNFMKCYYASGILVINSSFTISPVHDKRYSLTESHFPLWTTFCYPLMRYLNSCNIHTIGLGVEAKGLLRNVPNGSMVYNCPFPTDHKTISNFMVLSTSLINKIIFRIS
jgi:uracil DNA glycosylase